MSARSMTKSYRFQMLHVNDNSHLVDGYVTKTRKRRNGGSTLQDQSQKGSWLASRACACEVKPYEWKNKASSDIRSLSAKSNINVGHSGRLVQVAVAAVELQSRHNTCEHNCRSHHTERMDQQQVPLDQHSDSASPSHQ